MLLTVYVLLPGDPCSSERQGRHWHGQDWLREDCGLLVATASALYGPGEGREKPGVSGIHGTLLLLSAGAKEGDGPIGLILAPTRELCQQVFF